MKLSDELFLELFNGDELKISSPKMTPFKSLPKHRQTMILPVDGESYYDQWKASMLMGHSSKYRAEIRPSKASAMLRHLGIAPNCATSDVVVCEKTNKGDSSRVTFIKLSNPNGWSAETTIGKSFGEIHSHVLNASNELVMPKPEIIVDRCIKAVDGMERIGAISFREDNNLDRHPDDWIPETYESGDIFLRFERQGIMGMPEQKGFVFTIQTYFADLSEPWRAEKVLKGIQLTGDKSYARDVLASPRGERIIELLSNYSRKEVR